MIAWRGVIPIERVPAAISRDKATTGSVSAAMSCTYPLRAGRLMNFVRHHGASDWQIES